MQNLNLKCKSCGTPLQPEDIHLDLQYAICARCGTVFGPGAAQATASRTSASQNTPVPAGVRVNRDGAELSITYRWYHPTYLILFGFVLIWASAAVYAFYNLWDSLAKGAFTFIVLALPVVLGGMYFALMALFNSTVIRTNAERLTIQHKPLPWFGIHNLDATTLDQLYVKLYRTGSSSQKYSSSYGYPLRGRQHRTSSYAYQLCARLKNGHDILLLRNLTRPEQALYIEQLLEQYLEIPDRQMPDEYEAAHDA